MPENDFVHLHVHTEYSLLDGACRIPELIARAKALSQDTLAITDHGAMYGVIEFYQACKTQGIKPVIGCEVYVSPRGMTDKVYEYDSQNAHLVLLCKNYEGYQNLMKIVSLAYLEGFYYKPRCDKETLLKHRDGLIALSACLGGEIPQKILKGDIIGAKESAEEYRAIFGEDFYLELQNHSLPDQEYVNNTLIGFSQELGIPLVATNDVHYVSQEDSFYQDVLLCVQTGKTIKEQDRMRMETEEFYLKSGAQMQALFAHVPEAVSNTKKIAARCNVEIPFGERKFPLYVGEGADKPQETLLQLCRQGLFERYETASSEMERRLSYELDVIGGMGFADYFLIVWDFVKYARDHDIQVGPGRGSAAGSLVAYCLYITDIDPMEFSLLFERFLNPERISMPDIDIDFCYERRQEVIEYVIEKYGEDHVAQIITFGTMAARAAIRDCGRALDLSYGEVDAVAKQVPFGIHMTIDEAMRQNPALSDMAKSDARIKRLLDTAKAIEGMPRHASTHAAGVVITPNPVYEYVPMQRNDDIITTQYPMGQLEELGLLKMDFLGLRTLTVIRDAVAHVEKFRGIEVDIKRIDLNDPTVYEMISAGDTDGMFQLESAGMRAFLKELVPTTIEDIVAAVALYRPGPMDQIPRYIENKKNPQAVTYKHPLLEPILSVTYGCIIYQEQVMQIVRELGGYSLGRADLVRRAMSKKKQDVMQVEYQNFLYGVKDEAGNYAIDGAIRRGIDEKTARAIFDEILSFANYAFNKAHAAAYAIVAYRTAYLKVHYPAEFMAALMTSVLDSASRIAKYKAVCDKMGIKLLAPDVNSSFGTFTPDGKDIRYGLYAVKNVGRNFVSDLVKEREANGVFRSFYDFCRRMAGSDLNKRALASMIQCGCFDSIVPSRRKLMDSYEAFLDSVSAFRRSNLSGQTDFFSEETYEDARQDERLLSLAKDAPEYTKKELLEMEKEVTGLYLSGHPLDEYKPYFRQARVISVADLFEAAQEAGAGEKSYRDGQSVTVAGMVRHVSVKTTKNNQYIAFVTLEDLSGTVEAIVFYRLLQQYRALISEGAVLKIKGKLQLREEEEPKIICDQIDPIREQQTKAAAMRLYIKTDFSDHDKLAKISSALTFYSGDTPVYLYDAALKKTQVAKRKMWVTVGRNLLEELEELLGKENVKVVEVDQ